MLILFTFQNAGLCNAELSKDVVEVKIWFVRVCGESPHFRKQGLMDAVRVTTTTTATTQNPFHNNVTTTTESSRAGPARLNIGADGKPV